MVDRGDRSRIAHTDKGYHTAKRAMLTAAARSGRGDTGAVDGDTLANSASNDSPYYNGNASDYRIGCRYDGMLLIVCFLLSVSFGLVGAKAEEETPTVFEYGADVSYPMHHSTVTSNFPWLPHNVDHSIPTPEEYNTSVLQPLGDRQSFYTETIAGCVDFYGTAGGRCLSNERTRIKMSLRQPKSMVNYTKNGFTKIRAPDEVMTMLREFWDANRDSVTNENWKPGYVCLFLRVFLSFCIR